MKYRLTRDNTLVPTNCYVVSCIFSLNTKRKLLNTKTFLSTYPPESSEEFDAVDNGNVCTAPIMAHKDILGFVQSSKNIIDADSDEENKMNNVAPVPT
ncbi:hypothetical protein TNCV_2722911 [Trichonephila clavipes]|nr:hypothetical protein TNCV_2722911 [Trichonephila clavipes]